MIIETFFQRCWEYIVLNTGHSESSDKKLFSDGIKRKRIRKRKRKSNKTTSNAE